MCAQNHLKLGCRSDFSAALRIEAISGRAILAFAFMMVVHAMSAWGNILPVWTSVLSSPVSTGTNEVVGTALDGHGNIVVAGSSTGAAGDYDYVVAKYSLDGKLIWSARYASLSNGNDRLREMALDRDGNVYVTGSSITAKYSDDGALQWTAEYAGRGLAITADGHVYVTGFSDMDFATARLDSLGSNEWVRLTDMAGYGFKDHSEKVAVDAVGNAYVGGGGEFNCFSIGPGHIQVCYRKCSVMKYDTNGGRLWTTNFPTSSRFFEEVIALVATNDGVYYCANGASQSFLTTRISTAGDIEWAQNFVETDLEGARAMAVQDLSGVIVTGSRIYNPNVAYATYKADLAGNVLWQTNYNNGGNPGYHRANALALDPDGNIYVTGRSDNARGDADWATIKYSADGKEQWVVRYDGPAHGQDEANAIAIDSAGNIFVAGTQTATNGSTEIVLIKYADLKAIELLADGTAVLRFFGKPGQSYRLQTSSDLQNWSDLISGVAGTNGIAQFSDTNAFSFPTRFYRTVTP